MGAGDTAFPEQQYSQWQVAGDHPAMLLGFDDCVQYGQLACQLGRPRGNAHLGEGASGLTVSAGEEPGAAAAGLGQDFPHLGRVLVPGLGRQDLPEFRPDFGQRRPSGQKLVQLGPVAVPFRGLEVYAG